jgi:hypothetical protein
MIRNPIHDKKALTKIRVAESQLKFAIRLFFLEYDPILIEIFVRAASGVLRGLASRHGLRAFIHDTDWIKPEYKSKWIATLHKAQNFFKHAADQDADRTLEYESETLHFLLAETCYLYRHLASEKYLKHRQCIEAIAYELWFALAYPHLLKDPEAFKEFLLLLNFPNVDPNDFEAFRLALNIRGI